MGRLNVREGTIYEKDITGAEPKLGSIGETRLKTISGRFGYDKEDDEPQAKVVEQHQNRREASILKLKEISNNPSQILFQTKTIFPFDLFPDTLTITATKIGIKQNNFLNTYSTVTIPLQDIGYVEVDTALFFATMRIANIRVKEPVTMHYLPTEGAARAKKIIDGLLIVQESGVDISVIEPKELLPQIEALAA